MIEVPERKRLIRRWSQLKTERSSWVPHWQEISDYLLPRSGKFFAQRSNRGDKRHNKIYDSTSTRALRVLAAGMMAGMTSPARPWFRLTTMDPELDESGAVKKWLADCTRLMQMVFAKSNTYRALHSMYEELGAFGTSANIVLPDFQGVIHNYPVTCGEYAIATDYKGAVNTLFRETEMTVGQMVEEFGKAKCSLAVQNLYDRGTLDAWVTVTHAIEPRKNRDPSKRDNLNMAWKSSYFEAGGNEDAILREGGFKAFPALCPRWTTSGGDVYGNSPAMEALGDVRQLQHQQLRKAEGIDYMTKPPTQAPSSMKNQAMDMNPGGRTFVDMAGPNAGIKTAFEVSLRLDHLLEDIRDVRERINSCFFSDLFLMMANDTRSGITATEIAERHEEKLLMLGPVLERMHNEMLDPLVDLTFSRMMAAGVVPPPPEELQGMELNVEFVSMLAQAQRAVATNSVDRFVANLGAIAAFKPDVIDKLDSDKWADSYADMLGVDPELVVPGDKVALIRQDRAKAQAAAVQAEMANQGADTAQKLGSIDTSKPSALTDATAAFSGYT